MTSSTVRGWSNALLPLLAVVLAVGAWLVPRQGTNSQATDVVSVEQTSFVCPKRGATTMALGQAVAGEQRLIEMSDDGQIEGEVTDAATWSTQRLKGDGAIVTQDGEGSGAVGFISAEADEDSGGGLSVEQCGGVVDEAWFLGLGTADKRASTLVLANMSDSPAVADVMLWNGKGEVDAVNATGISVAPSTIVRIPLSDLAAGEPDLAAQVVRRRGVLAAMIVDRSTATFAGTEFISASQAPSRDQVVVGVDGKLRAKTLLLLNPGDQNARVDVTVYTEDGPVAAEELQDLQVKPGRYITVDVPDSVGAGQQTMRVVSDRNVVAAARVSPTVTDYLVAESAPTLDEPAIVPVELGAGVAARRLIVSALEEKAAVDVVAYDDDMQEIGRTSVEIPAQTTVSTTISKLDVDGDPAYLTVTATGAVVGAVTYTDGDRVSSLMLRSAPTTIDVPVVLPD